MTTTTSYGTWNNRVEPHALTVEQTVTEALGDFTHEYDLDAIAADYRAAINKALPKGVSLNGDEFYGPYPANEVDIKTIVETIDFWEITAKHER